MKPLWACSIRNGSIKTSVWAPTARSVKLKVYNSSKTLTATQPMTLDAATGIWSYSAATATLDKQFYRFELAVYHPQSKKLEVTEATDPYSVNVATNGRYSQFIDLNAAETKPEGWDNHDIKPATAPEDIVIYERAYPRFQCDGTDGDRRSSREILAFTEQDSAPVQHLKQLADSGLTHFHLLPATDMATVNEDASKRVDLTSTVAALCKLNAKASVCQEAPEKTLLELMRSYQNSGENAQALVESMRGSDSFNWGYDPHHFNVLKALMPQIRKGWRV